MKKLVILGVAAFASTAVYGMDMGFNTRDRSNAVDQPSIALQHQWDERAWQQNADIVRAEEQTRIAQNLELAHQLALQAQQALKTQFISFAEDD